MINVHAASVIGGDAIWATFVLAAMCGIMWFMARIAKRRLGMGTGTVASSALRVVGKRPLDQKSAIWVVEVGSRHLLLGSGADGTVTKLDDISPEEFALMTEEPEQPARIGLVGGLRRGRGERMETVGSDNGGDGDGGDGVSDLPAGDQPRFATVSESFQHLLGTARDARAARRAAGDE